MNKRIILPGYIINEEICDNDRLRIYRGHRVKDQLPVIVKILKENKANTVEVLEDNLQFFNDKEVERPISLDMPIIGKVIEEISKETDSKKLLKSLLEISIECSGSDRGCLILEKDGSLFVEVEKGIKGYNIMSSKPVSLKSYNNIPRAVVLHVFRTLETVALNGGVQNNIFKADSYISKIEKGSIVCLPILLQGISIGVLYLENSFVSGVFSRDRLEILKFLTVQMACVKKLQPFLEEDIDMQNEVSHSCAKPLTDRESDVLQLIADGMSNGEIAGKLDMTVNTVKTHIKNIYEKLQVNRRIQAIERAKKLKILDEKRI